MQDTREYLAADGPLKALYTEKANVDAMLRRLIDFRQGPNWGLVDLREQLLLVRQECHMERYASVLGERIALRTQT
jgi:hypothetical protein